VKAYEVFDKDGSYLAVFYADFHPRKGKQGGAWMTEYQGQYFKEKKDQQGSKDKGQSSKLKVQSSKLKVQRKKILLIFRK
jgi:peptidyl-dipeptidase Dcp